MMRALCIVVIAISSLCTPGFVQADSCSISLTGGFNFGNYDPYNAAPTNTTATNLITVTCSGNNGSATIDLSTGSSGSYFPRTMKNGANNLNYNLYTTANLASVWGNGTGGTVHQIFPYSGGNTSASYSVYGQIPALQNVNPGSYTDTITITVSF